MEIMEIAGLCLVVLCGGAFGAMLYFKVKGNVLAAVSTLIAQWEETDLPGVEKMYNVVRQLYELVPAPLRKLLTKERLEAIAQHVFDWMRKYAEEYRKKLEVPTEGSTESVSTEDFSWQETAVEIIVEMMNMTLQQLKEMAITYGVDPEGLTLKKDFASAILRVMLMGHKETEATE